MGGNIDTEKGKDSIAIRVLMFSKPKTRRACVNYDGTGSEVECNIDTNEGEYVLQNILSVGKNVYIIQDGNNMVETKISPKISEQYLLTIATLPLITRDFFRLLLMPSLPFMARLMHHSSFSQTVRGS